MKNKTNTYLIIGFLSLVSGAIVYRLMKKGSKKFPKPPNSDKTGKETGTEPVVSADQGQFPLKSGSHGSKVTELQTVLGFTGKDLDGDFGPKTLAALQKYGKTSIESQAELDALSKQISGVAASQKAQTSKYNRAQTLFNRWKSSETSALQVLNNNQVQKIVYLGPGQPYEKLSVFIKFPVSDKPEPRSMTSLINYTNQGMLIIKYNGNYYLADSTYWTVVV